MENKQNIKDLIQKFYPYAKETLGFEHPVRVIMRQDAENAQNSLGKTAYYDPAEKLIVLYITDRHPKDVLRSFSHELVHHAQNCRGELDDLITGGHYAENGIGREIESEAYLQGNLNVRDWENSPQGIELKGVNEMKMTKSQLKGIIESVIGQMSEGFPDLTGDGEVTRADILKGRGVKLKEEDSDKKPSSKEIKGGRTLKASPKGLGSKEQGELDAEYAYSGPKNTKDFLQRMIDKELGKDKTYVNPQNIDLELDDLDEQEVVTARSEEEKRKEAKKKENFKKNNPEFANALDSVKLPPKDEETAEPSMDVKESNDTWYNSSLYESLKSKWTK